MKRALGLVAISLLISGATHANNGGINSYSGNPTTQGGATCNACHTGGLAPSVVLDGPAQVMVGETHRYSLRIFGGQQVACGLNVSATDGELNAVEAGSWIFSEELTHQGPRPVDLDGECWFHFDWTAPLAAGAVRLYAAGNSVDLSQTTAGDHATATELVIDVERPRRFRSPPVARAGGPYAGVVGSAIAVDGSDSYEPNGTTVSYEWDFGDGGHGSGASAAHIYTNAGQYQVNLTLTDGRDASDFDTTEAIVSAEAPPIRAVRVVASDELKPAVHVTAPPGDPRLFVVRQWSDAALTRASIRIVQGDQVLPTPFLEIEPVGGVGEEAGLRGLTFSPDYATSGLFYVMYSDTRNSTVVARYRVSSDRSRAEPNSAEVLLEVPMGRFHHGSHLEFGPDGYLYIALGEGGTREDAQNDGKLAGKLLRIDVSGGLGSGYSIPLDNPFVGPQLPLDEIWAKGLRNPYRFDFDPATGHLYIADVGQASREEVNLERVDSFGGLNYGWPLMEGTTCFEGTPEQCDDGSLVAPIHEYDHSQGCSITGGSVYRGVLPDLQGRYFFADFCSSRIWSLIWDGADGIGDLIDHRSELIPDTGSIERISAIQPDGFGELVIVDRDDGELFRILSTAADTDGDHVPDELDNCSAHPNPQQADTDGDLCGNVCDPDWNQDGLVTMVDFGLWAHAFGSIDENLQVVEPHTGAVGFASFGRWRAAFGGVPGPSGLACP